MATSAQKINGMSVHGGFIVLASDDVYACGSDGAANGDSIH